MNYNINASIHNKYTFEVKDAKTGEIKQIATAYNTICDGLWSKISSASGYFQNWSIYLLIGSGTGTPSASDTNLFNCVMYTSNVVSGSDTFNVDYTTGIACHSQTFRIKPDELIGTTVTEVGISWSSSLTGGYLATHAMITDASGQQISIAKTMDDIIDIHVQIYVHFDPLGYNDHSVFLETSLLKNITSKIVGNGGALTSLVPAQCYGLAKYTYSSSSDLCPYGYTTRTWTSGTHQLVSNFDIPVERWNYDGIRGVSVISYDNSSDSWNPYVIYDLQLTTDRDSGWFTPTTITGESIGTGDGTTTTFHTKFSNVRNATIYVNGVAQSSGVTILGGKNLDTNSDGKGIFGGICPVSELSTNSIIIPQPDTQNRYTGYEWNRSALLIYKGDIWRYFYNPFYEYNGIIQMQGQGCTIEGSNDFVTWNSVVTLSSGSWTDIPSEYQNYKFWRVKIAGTASDYIWWYCKFNQVAGNIVFDTAPADGAVITADYTTPLIPKDTDHVLHMTITLTLNEYTES